MWQLLTVLAAGTLLTCRGQETSRSKDYTPSPDDVAVRGAYSNAEYGYSVAIPNGLIAHRMKAPAPQHGVAIPLNQGEIWVNGEYDATEIGSMDVLATRTAEAWSASDKLRLVRSAPTSMDGTPARELVLEREYPEGQINHVHVVVGLRAVPGGVGVIYTLGLRVRNLGGDDEKTFSAIVKSFRLTALPN